MRVFFRDVVRFIEHMSMEEYVLLVVVGIIIGALCLRGFGSRTHY